ncbi:MAG: hypothetical protein KDA58_08180, partial [Planctomycetaceae bacterium]|nr:hypothetical protein [Planctomycetaceae bacterium]
MGRWFTTASIGFLVQGMFRLYCHFLLPMVSPVGDAVPPPLPGTTEFHPPAFLKVAEEHFPKHEWTKTAAVKWQRGEQMFLFAESADPEGTGDGNTVRLEPLALLWKDPRNPDAAPYRLVAQKGRVQFENSFFQEAFDLSGADPGRIVWGSLEGTVEIYGPDGLQVQGRDFVFSEESLELYSYYPVQFAYGPSAAEEMTVAGTAAQLNLRFIKADDAVLGRDLPRVGGLESLNLRQNVKLQFHYLQDGLPVDAEVSSQGPFEFEFQKRTATFEEDVRIRQVRHLADGRTIQDRLVSQWLGIAFEELPDDKAASQTVSSTEPKFIAPALDRLKWRRVRAVGRQSRGNLPDVKVIVESEEHNLLANLHDLTYDAVDQVALLSDPKHVVVQRGQTRF